MSKRQDEDFFNRLISGMDTKNVRQMYERYLTNALKLL